MRRGTIGKAIVLVMAVGVLVTVSIVSDPERSSAISSGISSGISPVPHDAARWLDETEQWPLMGELISPSHIVRVYAADGGTMYTVCRPDGTVIQAGLNGDEVAESFPSLDLSSIGNDGYVLMQVETDR